MQNLLSQLGTLEGVLVVLGLVIVAGSVVWLYRSSKTDMAGGSKTRARGILRRYAAMNNCKLLDDVTLPLKNNGTAHADHILVGYFGVLVLHVLGEVGSYYGDDSADTWAIVPASGAKKRIPSPIKAGASAMEALRELFAKNEVYRVPLEQLTVVLPAFNNKREFCVSQSLPVVNGRKLKALLSKSRFQADKGVDVTKIAALLAPAAGK